ncbi:class I adenylate-forming enzyme family protein [Kitasatospora sp. NPDC098652]|uniref:class I adenylate-forming enzyme family protein n=1 Tax=Kitasatospora sp. NPDC098652 TaxID=3364095 RepID=UPI00382787CE
MVTAGGAWWSDAGGYVPEVLAALAEHPGKVVLRYPGTELTAEDYLRAVTGTYRTLRANGVGRGTVVAVLTAPNSPDMLSVRHAAHLAGAAVCYLRSTNPGTSTAMLPLTDQLGIVRDTGATVLYADRTSAARAAELAERSGAVLVGPGQDGSAGTAPTDDPGAVAPGRGEPDDLAVIMFTSGSTGRPKGIRKSLRSWEGTVRIAVDTPAEAAEITALYSTPLSHSAGLLVDGALAVGGSVVLLPEFDAPQVVRAVIEHRVTRTFMATTQLYRLLDHLEDLGHRDARSAGLAGLRSLSYSGTSAAPSRLAVAHEVFGPILLQLYGTTESGRISYLDPAGHADAGLAATVGRVFPEVELEVRDPDTGVPLADGQVGEIRMRSPQLMDGYLDPALDAGVLRDGWYRTGDIGYRDDRGYLHLLDRVSDVVKVDGVKIYPAVVERELLTVPGVALAAVYGVRDADGTEHLHAALTCRPGTLVEPEAVRKHISANLSPALAPERVLVLDELPMNPTGKPDKARLREHSAAATA